MNARTITAALSAGGKAAFVISALGGISLLLYSFVIDGQVVYLPYALAAVGLISTFIGGIQGGLASGTVGWLHGSAVAALYLTLPVLIRTVITSSLVFTPSEAFVAVCLLCAGAAGGVLGVNLRFSRSRRFKRRYMSY